MAHHQPLADAFAVLKQIRNHLTSLEMHLLKDANITDETTSDAGRIIIFVSGYYGVPIKSMLSGSRCVRYFVPRAVCAHLMRTVLEMTFEEIAPTLNRGDHGTVVNCLKYVKNRASVEPRFKSEMETLMLETKKMLNKAPR